MMVQVLADITYYQFISAKTHQKTQFCISFGRNKIDFISAKTCTTQKNGRVLAEKSFVSP